MTHKKNARRARKYVRKIEMKLDRQERDNPKQYRKNDKRFARTVRALERMSR